MTHDTVSNPANYQKVIKLGAAPNGGVMLKDDVYVAETSTPWLMIPLQALPKSSGYIEIIYAIGATDDPARPILRIVSEYETAEIFLPGPAAGQGIAQVYLPPNIRSLSISPVARAGEFNFEIRSIKRIPLLKIMSEVFRRRPNKLLLIFLAWLFRYKKEAINAIDWVINHERIDNFDNWFAQRNQNPLTQNTVNLSRTSEIRCVIIINNIENLAYEETILSIHKQYNQNYTIYMIDANISQIKKINDHNEEEIVIEDFILDIGKADLLLHLSSGSKLMPRALESIVAEFRRNKNIEFIYFDEISERKKIQTPIFKPNWSPFLYQSIDFIGSNFAVTGSLLKSMNFFNIMSNIEEKLKINLLHQDKSKIFHMRRLLVTTSDQPVERLHKLALSDSLARQTRLAPISIIIPTRDRLDLLRTCVDSVFNSSFCKNDEIIIINNQSKKKETRDYLRFLSNTDNRIRILDYDQEFNYSDMNNVAAKKAKGEIFVFLNNDTSILTSDWLDKFTHLTQQEEVGAVGACLLFPNGDIQHAGIILGIGQDAGHFESFQKLDEPSWLSRNKFTHEVSAVTGACLAVTRNKFKKIGGFDARKFPVEFSDIDLCLRLMAAGLTNVYTPEVKLIHKESSTRGRATTRPLGVYKKERQNFIEIWSHLIRDDPYFHPALSLYSRVVALD